MGLCCGGTPSGGGGGAGGSGGSSRKQYWGMLMLLAVACSGLYVMLYYRATLTTPSLLLFPRLAHRFRSTDDGNANNTSLLISQPPSASSSLPLSAAFAKKTSSAGSEMIKASPGSSLNLPSSQEALKAAILNGTSLPLLTLFSTWAERDDLQLVRNLTLRNWGQLKPFIRPVLFTNSSKLEAQARSHGWETLPVSKVAIGVPILKYMYLDAIKKFNSTLYSFANGDIIFTHSLVDSLQAILSDRSLPLDKNHLLVVGQRTNVGMVKDTEAATFDAIAKVAKARGKLFTTMAEDFFITDRQFDWNSIPGVVIGRVAYDNWLVLHAIQQKYVVVDVTKTVLAVHQTSKSGNFEGFTHANSSYNDLMLKKLYKRIHYMGGCVDCAPWRTLKTAEGRVVVEKRAKKAKHC
ncbi:uncharacterized protein [Littorina saxatilis]